MDGMKSSTPSANWIAILGRPDHPTDGVQDYCEFLGRALKPRGIEWQIARVDWSRNGWLRALRELKSQSIHHRGEWAVLQYTAFAWSRWGFPFGALVVLSVLRRRGARCAVVFHEPFHQGGSRWLDRLRGACQSWVIRRLYRRAEKAIFPEPLDNIRWLPKGESKAAFIPIGANVPDRPAPQATAESNGAAKTVAVFCVTGAPHDRAEIEDISEAARVSIENGVKLRFLVFGRGTAEAKERIALAFRDIPVEVSVLGLLGADKISDVLADSDAMLCVRGAIYSRRGSAIAGIASGLPIVGYRGSETGFPFTEAGLELVPYRDRTALAKSLCRVLSDGGLREDLRKRSRRAHAEYFSWQKIAERFVAELSTDERRYRVLLVLTHPIQYGIPTLRGLAKQPNVDLLTAYCSLQGTDAAVDPEFGVKVAWDTPVLEGYRWVQIPNRSLRPGLGRFWGLTNPGFWNIIHRERFDVLIVFVGYVYASFWIALAAAKLKRIPVIFGTDAHEIAPLDGKRWKIWVKRWLWPRLFGLMDVVVTPSTGGLNLMRSIGIPADRIVRTTHSVDNGWWTEQAARVDRAAVRTEWKIPSDSTVILFCGKLQPWKRPLDIVRAFAKAAVPASYLVIAGDGRLGPTLESEAKSLGIASRVRFLGFVNQTKLPAVYSSSDMLVLSSDYEAFGLVVNEAMLCGCPVVVSDRVGARFDLVYEGQTGFVYPAGDVDALAALLREVLPDRSRLQRMGCAARAHMLDWSPQENVAGFLEAIEKAVEFGRHTHR
jgi:glycosyltransferase involved in cell wall biosynthesis